MERHKLLNQMKGRYRLPPEIYKRSFQLNTERNILETIKFYIYLITSI